MLKTISSVEIAELAKDFGLSIALVKTVILVESAGRGFDPKTGNIKIQFEPHEFRKRTGLTIQNSVENQTQEWIAYEEAKSHNWKEALMSSSWGMGQIMGYNHEAAGYVNVAGMVSDFKVSEYYQVKGMLTLIRNNKTMYSALKRLDWALFARLYNGPKYELNDYDTKLQNAYNKVC